MYAKPCLNANLSFQGGIILDTVFNYDPTPESQHLPDSWKSLVPEATFRIGQNDRRGDFLAVIGRNHPEERKMSDLIRKWATLDLSLIHI